MNSKLASSWYNREDKTIQEINQIRGQLENINQISQKVDLIGSQLESYLNVNNKLLSDLEYSRSEAFHKLLVLSQEDFLLSSQFMILLAEQFSKIEQRKIFRPVEHFEFVLFNYSWHLPKFDNYINLGDYVQTIAVENLLNEKYSVNQVIYWDRDNLSFFIGDKEEEYIAVMQGWFSHSTNFLPLRKNIKPLWIGSHFAYHAKKVIQNLAVLRPDLLNNYLNDLGCRDLDTYSFCRGLDINCYLSRCLTLIQKRRKIVPVNGKIFMVDIPETHLHLFPKEILDNSIFINQKWVNAINEPWLESHLKTKKLLNKIKTEASMVITTALHCASPSIGMGIPTVLFVENPEENSKRFSTLHGIVKPHLFSELTQDDSFLYKAQEEEKNIEELKDAMKLNFDLSLKLKLGNQINQKEIIEARKIIFDFSL